MYSVETLGEGRFTAGWAGVAWPGIRSHHAAQKGAQLQTYELFIPRIFYLIFLDHGCPQVTETADKGGLLKPTWAICTFRRHPHKEYEGARWAIS